MIFRQSPPGYRNVCGPLIEALQTKLNEAGCPAGAVDGRWGKDTVAGLIAWQEKNALAQTGEVNDQTWTRLMGVEVPALFQRVLQLTGDWEGTGYGGANGNFDGQGITWGVVGFTWRNGELQGILKEIKSKYPSRFNEAFGTLREELVGILGKPLPAQMTWARGISIHSGQDILPPWAEAFHKLGDMPEVQVIENSHALHYWDAGQALAQKLSLESDVGLAMCFDIVNQITVTHPMLDEIHAGYMAGMSEPDKMKLIAQVLAEHANPTYFKDVLARKMTFALGYGTVHGDKYNVGCWGIGSGIS